MLVKACNAALGSGPGDVVEVPAWEAVRLERSGKSLKVWAAAEWAALKSPARRPLESPGVRQKPLDCPAPERPLNLEAPRGPEPARFFGF